MADLDQYLPKIAAGHSAAYAAWLAGAEPEIRASVARFSEVVDTEAVVQEALLRVWQVAPRLRPDGSPNALLRLAVRIARNLALSELRRRRASPLVVEEDGPDEPTPVREPRPPDPMLRQAIVDCRQALPPKPSAALDARLQGVGRPDRDLATELGMKLNTFLQNFTRARRMLASCLAGRGIDLTRELR
jgi:RNA polymerase sigma factor (sigma-70 family)